MEYDITVPSTADGALDVKVNKWLFAVGDRVEPGIDLVEMTTEKIALYAYTPVVGTLIEIVVPEGEIAHVGDVIGRVREI